MAAADEPEFDINNNNKYTNVIENETNPCENTDEITMPIPLQYPPSPPNPPMNLITTTIALTTTTTTKMTMTINGDGLPKLPYLT